MIIKHALMPPVDQKEKRRQRTLEAMTDVDAGQVIAHHLVQAWADRLGSDQPLPVPEQCSELDQQSAI